MTIIIKLDIDTPVVVEVPLAYQLLEDDYHTNLIDQNFKQHICLYESRRCSGICHMLNPHSHTIFINMGASLEFHGPNANVEFENTPAIYTVVIF